MGEDFDFFKSVEDEDIFPDVKNAAALEAADVVVLTEVVAVSVVEVSGFELLEIWLFCSGKADDEMFFDSGSGWLVTAIVVASVA